MYAQAAPGSLSRPDHFKMKLMVQLRHAMVAGDSGPGHQLQPKLCAVGRPTVVAGVLAKRFLLVLESRVASTGHLIRELQPVPGGGSSEQIAHRHGDSSHSNVATSHIDACSVQPCTRTQ